MPLSRTKTNTSGTRNTNKLPKRTKREVTSAKKEVRPTRQIFETRSESALLKPNNNTNNRNLLFSKRKKLKEYAKKKAQDELVTLFASKKQDSVEFKKKLTKYVKKYGNQEITEENSHIKENVRKLLMNNKDEIDFERIMALHLLSVRPARKCFRLQFIEEDEDDDENRQLTRYSEILPNYILVSDDLKHCDCFKDQNRKRIKSKFMHISINTQIEELLHATIEAIRRSNPSKLEVLWLQAFDTNNVKKLLNKEKFRYLMTSMGYNLKWLFGDNANVKTKICDLQDVTFYRVNKYRDYEDSTVFKFILPEVIYNEILLTDRTKYYLRIAEIGIKMVKNDKYLLPDKGLCIFQNPSEPAGIIILAENGQFMSLINGPKFHNKNSDKFSNIAMYVLFHSDFKDRSKEWEEIIQNKERKKQMDSNEIKPECSDEKLNEETKKDIIKRMVKSMEKEERRIFTNKYADAKRLAKNDENAEIKFPQIIKEIISINRILRNLSELPLKERQLAMKSSNYGGLGFARVIIGKNTMQLLKKLCNRDVTELQVTPIHNTNVLDTELRKISLKIPENIDIIYEELYNFEHSKSSKLFLTELETNKVKTFGI